METYIKKMTEIVKKHYEANNKSIFPADVRLQYLSRVGCDTHAIFTTGVIYSRMCLYEVVYYQDFDKFRVFCYKFSERFGVDNVTD